MKFESLNLSEKSGSVKFHHWKGQASIWRSTIVKDCL